MTGRSRGGGKAEVEVEEEVDVASSSDRSCLASWIDGSVDLSWPGGAGGVALVDVSGVVGTECGG